MVSGRVTGIADLTKSEVQGMGKRRKSYSLVASIQRQPCVTWKRGNSRKDSEASIM